MPLGPHHHRAPGLKDVDLLMDVDFLALENVECRPLTIQGKLPGRPLDQDRQPSILAINYKTSVKLSPFLRDGRGCHALCRNCLSMWPANILPSKLA